MGPISVLKKKKRKEKEKKKKKKKKKILIGRSQFTKIVKTL